MTLFMPASTFSHLKIACQRRLLALICVSFFLYFATGSFQPAFAQQSTGAWYVENTAGASPEKRHESAFAQVGDKFYLIGGRGTKKIQVYNPQTNQWSNTNSTTNNIHHFQAVTYNNKIYILGALTGNYPAEDPLTNIMVYDPVADKLTTGATIPANRRRGSSGVVVYNGKFYLVGGNRNGHSAFLSDGVTPANVNWFDEYDPVSNTWKVLPNAPHARDHFAAAVIGSKLYIAAGRRSKYGTSLGTFKDTEAAVDVYDFTTKQWLTGSSLPNNIPTQRAGVAVGVLNGELIVAGGEVDSNPPSNLALSTTEALNPNSGTWRTLAAMKLGRHASQAVIYQGDMYIPAGSKTKGGTEITATENFLEVFSFDGAPQDGSGPTFPQWTAVKNAIKPRSEAQCLLYQGELYFFNGFAPDIKIENSNEKFNPKTNTWTKLATMPSQSNGKPWAPTHNGIALVGDTVWIVGGRVGDNPGPVTNKVWWYKISTNTWIAGPNLPKPAAGGGLGRLGRKLHYVGGLDANASCDVNYHLVYDLDNPSAGWKDLTNTSPMPEPRNHFGTVVMDGKLYVIAGQNGHDGCLGGKDIKPVHVYDPATDQWTKLADFPHNESHLEPSVFALDGKIYVVGGQVKGNEVNVYNPATNQWTELTDFLLPQSLLAPGARILGDTMVVAVGGAPDTRNPTSVTRVKTIARTPKQQLGFNPSSLSVTLKTGETKKVETILYSQAGEASYTINTGTLPSWLKLSKTKGKAQESFEEIILMLNAAGMATGTYNYQLVASAQNYINATMNITLQVSGTTEPPVANAQYRINAGGDAQTVGSVSWEGCQNGNCNSYVTGGKSYTETPLPTISNVAAPLNQAIYQTEWTGGETTGIPVGGTAFSYNLPVTNGNYLVRLYFAELNKNGAGLRVFDVNIEKQPKLTNFDIFVEAGYQKAMVREFTVSVTDQSLTIDFIRKVQNAKISAIEVLPATAPPPPPPTAKATYWLEAECATVGSNWTTGNDAAASNGKYLAIKNGLNSLNTPPGQAANIVRLEVNINQTDNYRLLARVKAPSNNDDSFWVRVNGGTWIKWWQGVQTSNFNWKEVLNSPFSLAVGNHIIEFAYREDGTLLDKICLTSETINPSGTGGAATNCTGNPPPPPPPREGVVSFTLVNADTDKDIMQLTDGSVVDLNKLGSPNLNVRANTNPSLVGSVLFSLTGSTTHNQTENKTVYALFGNSGSDYRNGQLNAGAHQLKATAYTQSQGGGTAYPTLTVQFSVINGSATNTARMAPGTAPAATDMPKQDFLTYPNPVGNEAFVQAAYLQKNQPFRIDVLDIFGRIVRSYSWNETQPDGTYTIQTRDLPSGTYLIQVTQGKTQQRQKLIKP